MVATASVFSGAILGNIFLYVLMVQHVSGSGSLQIKLSTYLFMYKPHWQVVTHHEPTNISFTGDKVYSPQWSLSPGQLHGENDTMMTSDWPWTANTTCSAPTQYRFLICLDYEKGYDAENPCSLARVQTEQFLADSQESSEAESIQFSSTKKTGALEFILHFPSCHGPVKMSVYVRCCGEQDMYKGQCNEVLSTVLRKHTEIQLTGFKHTEIQVTSIHILTGRGAVFLSTSFTCDPAFYGPSCDIYCLVENPSVEHTFCNVSTGRKQCLDGWSGPDCQTDIDECQTVTCLNSGTCINVPGTFKCQCPIGTQGFLCELLELMCYTEPCLDKGHCFKNQSGYMCRCPLGFDGQRCGEFNTTPPAVSTVRNSPEVNASGTSVYSDVVVVNMTDKKNVGWRDEYWAIIAGAILCIVAVVVSLILYRNRANKLNKASSSTTPGQPPTNIQTTVESCQNNHHDDIDNIVHHFSELGFILQDNIVHNFNRYPEYRIYHDENCKGVTWKNLHPTRPTQKVVTANNMASNRTNIDSSPILQFPWMPYQWALKSKCNKLNATSNSLHQFALKK